MKTIERRAFEIPELERLEPIHTKGLQRVFGALRLVAGVQIASWRRRNPWTAHGPMVRGRR